ncbi:MAG TPA: hypothetical protein GX524_07990 [Firmicutes bacterium]|nr:hypothetical protein [Bacillota bacterium]
MPVDSRAIYDRLLEAAPDLLDRFADIMDRRVTAQGGETEILEPLH